MSEKENIDDNMESNPIKLKKKKTRLKKAIKRENKEEDEINNNNNIDMDEDSEKPKKKKRSKTAKKRKKKIVIDNNISENDSDINNDINDENETKKKKKRRRKRKRKNTDDNNSQNENEDDNDNDKENNINNIEENNDMENNSDDNKPKKKRRKKRKKKIDNNEDNDANIENNSNNNINEEENENKKKKKRRKKRKKNLDENNNEEKENSDWEEKEKSKSVKKRKKKRKKRIKKSSFDNNDKIYIYNPDEENTTKKIVEIISVDELSRNLRSIPQGETKLKSMQKNTRDNIISINNNFSEQYSDYDNCDKSWKLIKKNFLEEIEKSFNEFEIYDDIDIALISTTTIAKKEYGKFILTNHHEICPLKNSNNINWANEGFVKLRDKFYDLSSPGNLIEKNNLLDFRSKVCNEYEIYNANINLYKVSGTNTSEISPEIVGFLPKEKIKLKPVLILFFSENDEKSIIFFREVLDFLESYEKKEELIFMPIYAPLIQEVKNMNFVMDMLYKYKVYKKGKKFEVYFCQDNALNKRFRYISDDNKRNITCKTVFLDVINDKLVIRVIRDLETFTFNLIDKTKMLNKEKYKSTKKNLIRLKNNFLEIFKDTPLIEPYNCIWFLKKAKIYHISKEEKKLKLINTYYDGLTGKVNGEYLYVGEKKSFDNLFNIFNRNLGNYLIRFNPKNFNLSSRQLNKLIIEEMKKCIEEQKLQNVVYQSIFQNHKIILSIGSEAIIHKFMPIKSKSFKLEIHINLDLFEKLVPLNIIGVMQGLTLFSYFNNLDYICCLPTIGNTFPDVIKLTDSENFNEVDVEINSSKDKPSLLVIFSLAIQNYCALNELSSIFKLITHKLGKLYKTKKMNLYLIYRGELSNFKERFFQIKEEKIFTLCPKLYIKSSSNMKFPLIYQNNDIESTDSQLMAFILDKNNKLIYTGNLINLQLDKTFEIISQDNNDKIGESIIYKENPYIEYEEYKNIMKNIINNIENIFEKEIKKENQLYYRPFFSVSYNSYVNFENDTTDNKIFINHSRIRILIKEKHKDVFNNNELFKALIKDLKSKYDLSTIILTIESAKINIGKNCFECHKEIKPGIEPFYFEEEGKRTFCENCGEEFSNDIKNDSFVTFFNTNEYKDEVIQDMYSNFIKKSGNINPVLGETCKICKNKIGDTYYLNMTHFNIEYSESPIIPIDICQNCFKEMKEGDPFLKEPYKRLSYEKFGLDYKRMIYRKIYFPLSGKF